MSNRFRWRRIIIGLLLVGVALAGLAAVVVPRWNRYQVSGQIQLPGIESDIVIVRNEKGMPYIHAQNQRDLFFGQGFAAAHDRLFQMQLMLMQAQGRIAELAGDLARESDVRMRTIGIHRLAKAHAAMLEAPSREVFQAYSCVKALLDSGDLQIGSNNWVTSPRLSSSGHAMVVGDPHLDPRMLPGIMYAVGYVLPDARAVGVNVPGIPGFTIGRTEHIAIAVTNNYGDVQDLYIETIDPQNSQNYLESGKSIPFRVERQTLRIKDKLAPDGFRQEDIEVRLAEVLRAWDYLDDIDQSAPTVLLSPNQEKLRNFATVLSVQM